MRQAAFQERASTARLYARLLMPVTFVVLGTALWSDPQVGPKLADGLEEVRPIAAQYLAGTPLENILGPVPEATSQSAGADNEDRVTVSAGLPTVDQPVN